MNSTTEKAKARPSRLLNTKKAKAAMRKISQEDTTNSPFLQLPPELRNRIYVFALGDRTLHARKADDGTWKCTTCHRQPNSTKVPSISDTHGAECRKKAEKRFALLRCSRQIYEEAALIPYATNTFHLRILHGENTFLESLMPVQRRAIKSIEMSHRTKNSANTVIVPSRLLLGLTSLHPVLRRHAHDDWRFMQCVKAYTELQHGHLDSVQVEFVGNVRDNPSELKVWATRVEEAIAGGVEAARKRKDEEAAHKREERASKRQERGLRSLE